jgi:hypothetical protein
VPAKTRVYLEIGQRWVFACALDWPGWCRRAKGEQAALEALLAYAGRYAAVAGQGFAPGDPQVVARLQGNATTDFGAPDARGEWDDQALDPAEARRFADLLEACWKTFDEVVAKAPAVLRKGPRGGGRDRDAIVEHVRETERSYGRKIGARVPPGTPWEEQRHTLLAELVAGKTDAGWPPRYAFRRFAWHVLDHAWEIEDRAA